MFHRHLHRLDREVIPTPQLQLHTERGRIRLRLHNKRETNRVEWNGPRINRQGTNERHP